MNNLHIDETATTDSVTLALTGELDLASIQAFEERLAFYAQPGARVVLDLRPLNFMDCAGIDSLACACLESKLGGWTLDVITSSNRPPAAPAADRGRPLALGSA